ncbi:MAG: hypothetical protein ACLQVY_23220 [Limisphaerales bacterium]
MKRTQFEVFAASSQMVERRLRMGRSRFGGLLKAIAFVVAGLAISVLTVQAGNVYVPDYSFELPNIGTDSPYAAPIFDSWEEAPQPDWYNPTNFGGSPWSELMGEFYNVPFPGEYIDNCDGVQGAFLFAIPQVAIYQELNATFNPGKTYALTVGLIGGGGDMPAGSAIQLSLYYLDSTTNMVTVAAATVTNTPANFPTNTHFVDFQVQIPDVPTNAPWAGKNIGVQFLCTPSAEASGGYWDLDNVRLVEGIYVPNNSFELPNIGTNSPYAATVFDSWEEAPQPDWYNPTNFGGSPWSQLMGEFYNVPFPGEYIDNCDGVQGAFLFATPQVAIFQDYNAIGEDTNAPSHAFNAKFNAGKAYTMTVGLIGGGGDMPEGSTIQLSLYYRDASSNMQSVAAATVTNTAANFPTNTHFVDFQVQVPGVKATDPWAGQNIGVQLLCTPTALTTGGYWDADNVRLEETTALNLANATMLTNGQIQFTVQSEANAVVQVLATTNLSLPVTAWANIATLTNTTGSLPFVDTNASLSVRFYTAEQSP